MAMPFKMLPLPENVPVPRPFRTFSGANGIAGRCRTQPPDRASKLLCWREEIPETLDGTQHEARRLFEQTEHEGRAFGAVPR
jgi:hypothetical protein